VNAGGALKLVEDGRKDRFEIGCSGDTERRLGAERREEQERKKSGKKLLRHRRD
jgi:hypothetical protein